MGLKAPSMEFKGEFVGLVDIPYLTYLSHAFHLHTLHVAKVIGYSTSKHPSDVRN